MRKKIVPSSDPEPKEGVLMEEDDGSIWRHDGIAWIKIWPIDSDSYRIERLETALKQLISILSKKS